jgi:hypothetical protein
LAFANDNSPCVLTDGRITSQPSVVILDAHDPDVDRQYPLATMLEALPSLKVIRLDSQQEHIQVVTSEQRRAASVDDLLDVIGPSR